MVRWATRHRRRDGAQAGFAQGRSWNIAERKEYQEAIARSSGGRPLLGSDLGETKGP